MKKQYPDYKGKNVNIITKKLGPKDKKILHDFLEYCAITAGEKKIRNIERIILQIYDVIERGYGNISLKDLRGFLALLNNSNKLHTTQNDIKKVLKRFLKWHYKDWSARFNDLKDIQTHSSFNEEKINPSTILKPKELEKLIRAAENLKYKALIILMYESGGRPEEILKLKWSDIDFNRKEVKLYSSKTGKTRVNPLNESIVHLKRHKQEYPFMNIRADDFVFPSPDNRKKHISIKAIYEYLKKLGFKVLGRAIFPYLIRHTRLTQIHKTLPTQVACKFAGHSPDVAKRYTHLTNDDVREAMLEKIYHVEEIGEEGRDTIKKLEKEISKLINENITQKESLTGLLTENKEIWKWLEKLTLMNKMILKAVTREKRIKADFKKQFKKMFSEGDKIYPIREVN
jgi:integrase